MEMTAPKLIDVITLPKDTVLRYSVSESRTVSFHDTNRNQRLDPADIKLTVDSTYFDKSHKKTSRVTEKDIESFGKQSGEWFQRALQERKDALFAVRWQFQAEGRCILIEDLKKKRILYSLDDFAHAYRQPKGLSWAWTAIDVRFMPALSIHTLPTKRPQRYENALKKVIMSPSGNRESRKGIFLDPAFCSGALALVHQEKIGEIQISGVPTEPMSEILPSGGIMAIGTGTFWQASTLLDLGLKTAGGYGVAYSAKDGVTRWHGDLGRWPTPFNN